MKKYLFIIFFTLSSLIYGEVWKENPPYKGLNSDGEVRLNDFSKLAKILSPTVVNIQVEVEIINNSQEQFQFYDDPMYRFFDHFFDMPKSFKNRGIGSGFLISDDGYIVTNNHVINNATSIKVSLLDDDNIFDAEIVGQDKETDLALIKIKPKKKLPFAYLGDSDKLDIGEWVMAIGNPFGLQHTVTAGIVSAKERKEITPGNKTKYYNFIQTDASINPGHSGGPLFNIKGEVIGINTAINASGQNIGFAIPINMAKKIISQIIKYGKVRRTKIGVSIQKITKELAESFGMEKAQGALVTHVLAKSPADIAGAKEGDVILSFGKQQIKTANDLPWFASMSEIGETKEIEILRDGKKEKLQIKMAPMDDDFITELNKKDENSEKLNTLEGIGISVRVLTKREKSYYRISTGVVVEFVKEKSLAKSFGIQPNDLIIKINDVEISSSDSLQKELQKVKKGDMVRFFIKREYTNLFIAFRIN